MLADSEKYPRLADLTSDFVYARLQDAKAGILTGYRAQELDKWRARANSWQSGNEPDDFPLVAPKGKPLITRDVFVYFINGAKERAPAAAAALIKGFESRRALDLPCQCSYFVLVFPDVHF